MFVCLIDAAQLMDMEHNTCLRCFFFFLCQIDVSGFGTTFKNFSGNSQGYITLQSILNSHGKSSSTIAMKFCFRIWGKLDKYD